MSLIVARVRRMRLVEELKFWHQVTVVLAGGMLVGFFTEQAAVGAVLGVCALASTVEAARVRRALDAENELIRDV